MKTNKHGFTLIELIVVIAILAIIAAVAVPTAFGSIENARKAACKSNEDGIQSAWRLENADEKLAATAAGYTARSDADILDAALANCGLTQSSNKISGLCPSGGTYTLKINNGALEINCEVHDLNAVQQKVQSINDWINNYSETLTETTVNILKKYQEDTDNYANTPLTPEEVALIFGDNPKFNVNNIASSFHLRPLPVIINGKLADVQFVSPTAITSTSGQTAGSFNTYAIIVNGVTYVHYDNYNKISNSTKISTSESDYIANLGKPKYGGFTSIDDFINKITTNDYYVPLT